jgi:hypothetical protein
VGFARLVVKSGIGGDDLTLGSIVTFVTGGEDLFWSIFNKERDDDESIQTFKYSP